MRWSGTDWIHLAQVTDQWFSVVNTVMKLQVYSNTEHLVN
jgi:hypothetical protein